MELIYAQLSVPGPVRARNEDFLGFWQPAGIDEERNRGSVAVLADGVGGNGQGDVASRLAVETVLRRFTEARPGSTPQQLLRQMFAAANKAVYDAGLDSGGERRMATTLTASVFRNNEVTIGHVGDCRVYLVQNGRLRCVTTDHSLAAAQVKLGLLSAQDAMTSPLRCVLTRSIGKEPPVQVDYATVTVNRGDRLVQCCDGIHAFVTEAEILEIVGRTTAAEACRELIALAEKHGTDDNLSVQVLHVQRVEQLLYYRGLPVYQEAPDLAMSHEVQLGDVLDERFHVTNVLSRSGMATIFKATDLKTGKVVALKVPFVQFESDPSFFARFEREEAIGKLLDHPSILHILPLEEPRSRPYIAMEHLEGETLRKRLRAGQPLPVDQALQLASRICEGLEYMHRHQVIHRDLKPENIMLCTDGSLRIMDFGIAKAAGLRRLTFTGFTPTMGTPDYMAPEQVKGKRGDERTDLYSLGAMLYEMVTGTVPFEGANPYIIMNARLSGDPVAPRKINPALAPQVEEIILHAMERSPYDRYPSAVAMKAELDHPETVTVTGRSERLKPPSLGRMEWRTVRWIVVAFLVPLVVLGLVLLFLQPWNHH